MHFKDKRANPQGIIPDRVSLSPWMLLFFYCLSQDKNSESWNRSICKGPSRSRRLTIYCFWIVTHSHSTCVLSGVPNYGCTWSSWRSWCLWVQTAPDTPHWACWKGPRCTSRYSRTLHKRDAKDDLFSLSAKGWLDPFLESNFVGMMFFLGCAVFCFCRKCLTGW